MFKENKIHTVLKWLSFIWMQYINDRVFNQFLRFLAFHVEICFPACSNVWQIGRTMAKSSCSLLTSSQFATSMSYCVKNLCQLIENKLIKWNQMKYIGKKSYKFNTMVTLFQLVGSNKNLLFWMLVHPKHMTDYSHWT